MVTEGQAKVDPSLGEAARQVLTFTLGAESYGVDILRVQEIRGWAPVTRIPKSPEHVLGVLNLRGSIVPIVDLRRRFGLEEAHFTALTVIIVLFVESPTGRREFGLVVDAVSDVMDIQPGDMKPAPELGSRHDADFLLGLATLDEKMVMLLDVDCLISLGLIADTERAATVTGRKVLPASEAQSPT